MTTNELTLWILAVFCAVLVAAAIVIRVIAKNHRTDKLVGRGLISLGELLAWMGVTGLILTFFRYENAAFLSRRFWLAVWLLSFGVWLIFVVRYFCARLPKLRQERDTHERIKKYLL